MKADAVQSVEADIATKSIGRLPGSHKTLHHTRAI